MMDQIKIFPCQTNISSLIKSEPSCMTQAETQLGGGTRAPTRAVTFLGKLSTKCQKVESRYDEL